MYIKSSYIILKIMTCKRALIDANKLIRERAIGGV